MNAIPSARPLAKPCAKTPAAWRALSGGLDGDALAQQTRILADGGVVTDINFLSAFIASLKAGPGNCYSALAGLWLPVAVKKDGANVVERIYDVSPAKTGVYYDATQSNASLRQTWTDNQLDGKPVIQFDAAKGGYSTATITQINQPDTLFTICRKDGGGVTIRSIIDSTSTRQLIRYAADTTSISYFAGSVLTVTSAQASFGQFTATLNGASSILRRKGTQIHTGNAGANNISGAIVIGMSSVSSQVHNGPIALCIVGASLSDAQRDYIEGQLNTTYFPSTIA